LTVFNSDEPGTMLSRAMAKMSRALAAAPMTHRANIEKTTTPMKVRDRPDPIQYSNTPGRPSLSNELSLGTAMTKPISTIIPSTALTTTDPIIARGTERRASTASSDMSAAASKPTIVKMPMSAASVIAYQ
jgi:hypothetical protein